MNPFQSLLSLVARILLALMFVVAGTSKIGGFEGTAAYIAAKGLPLPEMSTVLTIVVELGAGLALIAGFKARWAAALLAIFTLAASFIFHNYWALPVEQQSVQTLMFIKNIAVTGGLLMVLAFGAGGWSLDSRSRH